MKCSAFIGHDEAKLALILNAIDTRCGGVLFVGEKGCGKSTLARSLKGILPSGTPFVELPLNITEEALLGTIAIEDTLRSGTRIFQPGIFSRAHKGVLFIDDVNLLSPEIVSLILEVQGSGENIVEREGIRMRHPASFILVASMYPEEGGISPHLLDRFGMCAGFERLGDISQRMAVARTSMCQDGDDPDIKLAERIETARRMLSEVSVKESFLEYIADICMHYNVAGHRADLYLLAAARAHAALKGNKEVTKEDINVVAPLVLMHRRRELQPPQPPEQVEEPPPPPEHNHEPPPDNQQEQQSPPPQNNTDEQEHSKPPKPRDLPPQKEEVFAVGQQFSIKRIAFRKDRVERAASGRRTRTRARNRGGRYVKSVLRKTSDIAIDATLRAAAPFQAFRKRTDVVVIDKEDFRYKRKERKMGHLAIFVVDGSGSMGVHKRMVAAKGAVQSLLIDCYQKRDMVAMIVFRKDRAEVVLAPTASVEHAARRLKEIPVGGKTPLGAGLFEAYRLLERVGRKRHETRFLVILITDGRANQSMSSMTADEEIERIAALLSEWDGLDIIVVDTEEKGRFTSIDRAASIAALLNAEYYTIDALKSEYLVDMVKRAKEIDLG